MASILEATKASKDLQLPECPASSTSAQDTGAKDRHEWVALQKANHETEFEAPTEHRRSAVSIIQHLPGHAHSPVASSSETSHKKGIRYAHAFRSGILNFACNDLIFGLQQHAAACFWKASRAGK